MIVLEKNLIPYSITTINDSGNETLLVGTTSGQIIEVFAGYTHHSTTYGAVLKQIYAQRSTTGNAPHLSRNQLVGRQAASLELESSNRLSLKGYIERLNVKLKENIMTAYIIMAVFVQS